MSSPLTVEQSNLAHEAEKLLFDFIIDTDVGKNIATGNDEDKQDKRELEKSAPIIAVSSIIVC